VLTYNVSEQHKCTFPIFCETVKVITGYKAAPLVLTYNVSEQHKCTFPIIQQNVMSNNSKVPSVPQFNSLVQRFIKGQEVLVSGIRMLENQR